MITVALFYNKSVKLKFFGIVVVFTVNFELILLGDTKMKNTKIG